jgi:hypothetical protein
MGRPPIRPNVEPRSRLTGAHLVQDAGAHRRVGQVAPGPAVHPAYLVQPAAAGQQADHAGVLRVDVGHQQQRPGRGVRRQHREVRERPHRVVQDRHVQVLVGQPPRLAGGQRVAADLCGRDHHRVSGFRQHRREGPRGALDVLGDVAVDEVPSVGDREQSDACHGGSSGGSGGPATSGRTS